MNAPVAWRGPNTGGSYSSPHLLTIDEGVQVRAPPASPRGQFTEVARFPAVGGKTWNHPVLSGSILLVRNGQEMVAFRLPLAGG